MKMSFVAVVFIMLLVGCSKGSNPVQFSRIEARTETKSEPTEEIAGIILPERAYTLLEMYLLERINRSYFMSWFFSDIKNYREKIYLIKEEIHSKIPLSTHDYDLIVLLEDEINAGIRKFNDKNVISRSIDVVTAAVTSPRQETRSYAVDEVKYVGMPAKAISKGPMGFLNSFTQRGFTIQEVDFLDRTAKP